MQHKAYQQIAVVQTDTSTFEETFNNRIREITSNHKITSTAILVVDNQLNGIIVYECEEKHAESVADEFYLEGIHYLCKNCPYLEDPKDKRRKRCVCKYSEYGTTRKDQEACELFYKELKSGRIVPVEDYMR